jgi:hypothetical protein
MIKIKEEVEEIKDNITTSMRKIHVTLENNEQKIFDSYPIIIKSKDLKHLTFEIQKSTKTKTHVMEKDKSIDKVKEKAKDIQGKVIDTTKNIAEKTKDKVNQHSSTSTSTSSPQSTQDRIDEQSKPEMEIGQLDDPLISRK